GPGLPLEERRERVERLPFQISPATRDAETALHWLERLEVAGFDGVIAKGIGLPYLPGSRDGVVKVKQHKTVDCAIVGFRWSEKAEGRISTVLLGLYEGGRLDFVGHCSGFPPRVRAELEDRLPKLLEPGHLSDRRIPGGQSRWSAGKELDWNPVRPELVCEVRYDSGRVLDVGCGGGCVCLHLQERGQDVVGIDVSPGAIEVCRRRGVRDVRLLSIDDVDHSLGQFDTVVMLGNNIGLLGGRT